MTATQLKEAMFRFANNMTKSFEKQLTLIDIENKTECKALTIQKNISENCADFVSIDFGGRYYEVRENFVFDFKSGDLFESYREIFSTLKEQDKELFLTFAYPMLMVLKNFYIPRVDQVENETNVEKCFEAKIIIGTASKILEEWQRLWDKSGCIKCEVFK